MKVKRIVTGRNEAGESVFVSVTDAPKTHDFQHVPGMSTTQLWATPPAPTLDAFSSDPTLTQSSVVPAAGGSQFLIVGFPPDRVMMSPSFNPAAAAEENLRHSPGIAEKFEPDNPGMHTTDTIDYGIVLRGEIWLELDGGRMEHLRAGDVVVQNGTRHAWRNRGDEVALVAFAMIGAVRR
ncbi:MAG TPA: cupin domain-containing protein [Steroidobacteraceae bacterium]|nr:cupin domain-containing protein [Steroidobacteraceae bacterium]